mgnify:FL=1
MKTTMRIIGAGLVIIGLMAVAGSGNDCDGHCMENANSLGDMLLISAGGIVAMCFGGFLVWISDDE